MSKDHSLYVIVLPVSEIGGSLSECRVRTLDEIVHRYIFWLRFVFSVVRRDDTFPVFADDTKGSAALSHHMAVEHTNPNAHTAHRGIPIIPVINKFSRLNDSLDDSYYQTVRETLARQLRNLFVTSDATLLAARLKKRAHPDCDFLVPSGLSPILLMDNVVNHDVENLVDNIVDIHAKHPTVSAQIDQSAVVQHVVRRLSSDSISSMTSGRTAYLPLFVTESLWSSWLRETIVEFFDSSPIREVSKRDEQFDSVHLSTIVTMLATFCEEVLTSANCIVRLSETVNGYCIVTDPAALSSAIVGDLLCDGSLKSDEFVISQLLLTQDSIIDKLEDVHFNREEMFERSRLESQTSTVATVRDLLTVRKERIGEDVPTSVTSIEVPTDCRSAVDYFKTMGELAMYRFPLVKLMSTMGVAVQIQDSSRGPLKSWFLGLAPEIPRGKVELLFDTFPDHVVRRYFRLQDKRSCLIPGFFMRVFVNLVNNCQYQLKQGYGNAAKLFKVFKSTAPHTTAVTMIIAQLPDKDFDAFVVAVGATGPQSLTHCFNELNVLQSFVLSKQSSGLWGLSFIEYCLFVRPMNQRRLISVREDLIDDKVSVDEVESRIFGVPVSPDSSSLFVPQYANSTHGHTEDIDMCELHRSTFSAKQRALSHILGESIHEYSPFLYVSSHGDTTSYHVTRIPIGLVDARDTAIELLDDCLAARHNALHLYFGMSKAKRIQMTKAHTELQSLVQTQRMSTLLSLSEVSSLCSQFTDFSDSDGEYMDVSIGLSVSDLSQRYCQSCYTEENLQSIVTQHCRCVDDVIREAQLIPAVHECQRRELLYRMLRLYCSSHNNDSHSIKLREFDEIIDKSKSTWSQDCVESQFTRRKPHKVPSVHANDLMKEPTDIVPPSKQQTTTSKPTRKRK